MTIEQRVAALEAAVKALQATVKKLQNPGTPEHK